MAESFPWFIVFTIISLLSCLAIPSFVDWFNVYFFAPTLVNAFYLFSIETVGGLALLFGCFIDCIYLTPRMGFTGTAFLLTTFLLYPQKRFFFKDALSTLPIMTFFFAFISSIIEALIAHIFFSIPSFLSLRWFFVDSLLMSLLDAAYAFFFFSVPCIVFAKTKRVL